MARADAAARNRSPLDWLNDLFADVQGGVGPFLAVFLTSSRGWNAAQAGLALTAGGLITVLARSPSGALVDATHAKRTVIALAAAAVAAGTIGMALFPTFWPVMAGQAANGAADAIFPASLAAISLGIVGRAQFAARVGRNEAFNHAGNVATAVLAGATGRLIGPSSVLWLAALLAGLIMGPLFAIRASDIDHRTARGGNDGHRPDGRAEGVRSLLSNRPLIAFTASITLFHFANAAMLPLVGEELSRRSQQDGSLFIGACIVVAQIAMVPMAILVGRYADAWGRRRLFLVGLLALPVRGLLFSVLRDPAALIAVQLLDGIGAGIFGALFPLVVADLTEGTGRYNLAQGASATCWGLGAALSNAVAGYFVVQFGYGMAFWALAAVAALALACFAALVPETRGWAHRAEPSPSPSLPVRSVG
jgi:MFS family permease